MFKLETIKAKHGDCLLLHWGSEDAPHLILVDGGPGGVYAEFLRPRLEELREERGEDRLLLDLVMLSHIDDDHIRGLIDLFAEIDSNDVPVKVKRLWHNSLEKLLKHDFSQYASAALEQATASLAGRVGDHECQWYSEVLSSVPQGQTLHHYAVRLGLGDSLNKPFRPLVMTGLDTSSATFSGLTFTIIGPAAEEVQKLQKKWVKLRDESITAAYSDPSPYNLSSIVVLAEYNGMRMLLTGDARGDLILEGLERAGLLDDKGCIHLDLLKLQHHGSPNNTEKDFFRRVRADVYVVSGDHVKHPNPHVSTVDWLVEARGDDDYTVYCPYELEHMRERLGDRLVTPAGQDWIQAVLEA